MTIERRPAALPVEGRLGEWSDGPPVAASVSEKRMTQVSPTTGDTVKPQTASKWDDPSVPAGNAPAMPKWPLPLMLVVWVAWVGFLAAVRFGLL